MKKGIILLALVAAAANSWAGIYRHDTPPEKYKALAAQKQFDCVGMVLKGDAKEHAGSCVLIDTKYVLSAAHVFVEHTYRQDTYYIDKNGKNSPKMVEGGSKVMVNQPIADRPGDAGNYWFRFNGMIYRGKAIRLYPNYLDNAKSFYGDAAVIELEEEVTGITPAMLNHKFDELNTVITGFGFGASGPASKPEDVGSFQEKIAGQNTIDKLDGPVINGQASLIAFDFDHPTRKDCNRMGSSRPLALEYKTGGGDSGGGIFREKDGRWELIGIITGGPNSGTDVTRLLKTGYYGQVTEQTRVSVFADWIENTVKELENKGMSLDTRLK